MEVFENIKTEVQTVEEVDIDGSTFKRDQHDNFYVKMYDDTWQPVGLSYVIERIDDDLSKADEREAYLKQLRDRLQPQNSVDPSADWTDANWQKFIYDWHMAHGMQERAQEYLDAKIGEKKE